MHEEWEIRSLPREENLEKTWRNLEKQDLSEMRVYRRENREPSRDRSREMRIWSHEEA